MNARLLGLLISLPVLGIIYIWGFTDWLKPAPIEVIPSIRGILPKRAYGTAEREFAGVYPVIFNFDDRYALTSIRVEEAESTNGQPPRVLWHLVSRQGCPPTKAVLYGRDLDNMTPAPGSPNSAAGLVPGKRYRLILQAGRRRGEATFSTREMADLRPNF